MKKRLMMVLYIAFGVYLLVLLKITVFRAGISLSNLFRNGIVIYDFFAGYLEMIRYGMFFEFIYLFVGNIIWFVPFGFLLPCLSKSFSTFPRVLLSGLFLSLVIEFLQYAFGTGISEADDLILNTLGALIGYALYRLIHKLKRK
jgi:glycopeptide antibiotics resistance protein